MFTATFEEGKGDELLGGAPDPEHDNDENIISVFINKVINPDKPFGSSVSHSKCIQCYNNMYIYIYIYTHTIVESLNCFIMYMYSR